MIEQLFHGGDRVRAIFVEDHVQSVGEGVLLVLDRKGRLLSADTAGGPRCRHQDGKDSLDLHRYLP